MITKKSLIEHLKDIPDDYQIIFNSEKGVFGKLYKSAVFYNDRVIIINLKEGE